MTRAGQPIISTVGVTKAFDGVVALRGVDLSIGPAEAHGLIGENGAGKSTLIKTISGALQPDAGTILLDGEEVVFPNPHAASIAGIGTVHQEDRMVPNLTVRENIELGNERSQFLLRFLSNEKRAEVIEALRLVGMEHRLQDAVGTLSWAERQLVAVARMLARGSRIVIFDEPTAALSPAETKYLFEIIDRLRERGTAILYVTHRLDELRRTTDQVTVMRDGQIVSTVPADTDENRLVRLMAGEQATVPVRRAARGAARELSQDPPRPGGALLEVSGLTDRDARFREVDLELGRGEIVALVGLPDSGVAEFTQAVAGARRTASGELRLDGRALSYRSPRHGIQHGIGYLPGDRAAKAVVPNLSVRHTVSLTALRQVNAHGWAQPRRERSLVEQHLEACRVKAPSVDAAITALSGGNQQKALLARMLAARPRVLVCEEPTAGVDVAGRESLYELIAQWAGQGNGVLWTTSDLKEVALVADRAVVFWRGRVAAELRGEDLDENALMESQFNQFNHLHGPRAAPVP